MGIGAPTIGFLPYLVGFGFVVQKISFDHLNVRLKQKLSYEVLGRVLVPGLTSLNHFSRFSSVPKDSVFEIKAATGSGKL